MKNPSKQRASASRKCGEHAHHKLRISLKKLENQRWRHRYGAGLDLKDQAAASTKVQNYWRERGFREIGKTGSMLMSPDDLDEAGIINEMTR